MSGRRTSSRSPTPARSPSRPTVPAHGYADVTVSPHIPARFGGYALVLDLGPAGRQFLTSCVRTFAATQGRVQYPKFCLDALPLPVLKRLDVHAIRWGVGYKPTTDEDFAQWYADRGARTARATRTPTSPCCSWSAAASSSARPSRWAARAPGWTTRA